MSCPQLFAAHRIGAGDCKPLAPGPTPVPGATQPRTPVSGLRFLRRSSSLKVHGTRCTHLINCMPYRDPAQRAAWMREYRKRKRAGVMGASASFRSTPSGMRASESSRVPPKTIDSSIPRSVSANTGTARKTPRSSFKTALQLARTFPFGVLASHACPYCYNTGYSSPGTRCSYCRSQRDESAASRFTSRRL